MAENPDKPKARFRVRRVPHADEAGLEAELNGAAGAGYDLSRSVGLPILALANGDLLVITEGEPEAEPEAAG